MTKIKTSDRATDEPEIQAGGLGDDAATTPEPELGEEPAKAGDEPGSKVGDGSRSRAGDEPGSEDGGDPGSRAGDGPGGKARGEPEQAREPAPRRLTRDPLIRAATLVTLVAAAAAAWFGWSYHAAAGDDDLAYAAERDRVLAVADQAIVNLNTLDHRDVDAGLKVWQDSTTAQLYDQIAKGGSRLKAEVKKAETTSTAKILESGLTELDTRAGKAAVIAAVRVTITRPEGQPSENVRRLAGQLTRTPSGWKLSALGQAPTGTP